MARKRRRKRSSTPAPVAEPAPVAAPQQVPVDSACEDALQNEDETCLSHPSYNLDFICDDCGVALCRVCCISFGSASLCSECFERRVAARRRGGSWHGWAALLAALLGFAAMIAPFTIAEDPRVAAAFPGGGTFFIYGSSFGAAIGVLFGLGAQDFNGIGKRAGWSAVFLGIVVLVVNCLMNVTAALGA